MSDQIFTCYARLPAGDLKRLEVVATCDLDARRLAFDTYPRAIAVSCRAGAQLDRRAQ